MTSELGSFARKTIVERKPQILGEVSRAHSYPSEIQVGLRAFADEISNQPVRPLLEDAPDIGLWNGAWSEREGHTWLDVPWYFAETFFYRRLMEVVRFYQPGPWYDVDPFGPQKIGQLDDAIPTFLSLLRQDADLLRRSTSQIAWRTMMHDALWGNRADLSNRTISAAAGEGLQGQQAERLLIDDTPRIWRYLRAPARSGRAPRVDLVADNSGLELLLDLRLADYLLQQGLAREVRFHLKRMPFFVSDARVNDLEYTLGRLADLPSPGCELAARLRTALSRGTITLRDDPLWSSCLSYHQLTPQVLRELAASDLVLFKGDVNYRRLLDDRHWPHTARLADIVRQAPQPVPVPFVSLRTLKGELIVDLEPGQARALAAVDPTWLINGQRGLVQFVNPKASPSRSPRV